MSTKVFNQTQTSFAKLQSCIHIKILTLAANYGVLFSMMAQKQKMDDTYTHTCVFEHISSCSIAHMRRTPSPQTCVTGTYALHQSTFTGLI